MTKKLLFIVILSLLLQLSNFNWGLVTNNPNFVGLAAFHMDEPGIAQIPVNMVLNRDLNPHWFIQPSGYIYTIFIPLYLLKGFIVINTFNAMVLGRFISVLFTILTLIVVYNIGKLLYNEKVGLYASLLLAINPYFFQFSIFVKQDSMLIFLTTLSFYFLLKYVQLNNIKYYSLSILFAGMATSTKYIGGLILIFLLVFFIAQNISNIKSRVSLKQILSSVLIFISGFVLLTPFSILSTKEFFDGAIGELMHYSTGHEGMGQQPFYTHVITLLGLWDNYTNVIGMGISILFIFTGLIFLIKNKNKMSSKLLLSNVLLILWILFVFLTFSVFIKVKMTNQMLISIPFMMLIGGYGIHMVLDSKSHKIPKVFVVLLLLILTTTYTSSLIISRENDNRYYVAKWLNENIEENDSIAVTPYVYVPSHFTNVTLINTTDYNSYWLQRAEFDYIIISSKWYGRYFYYQDQYPEKHDFFNQIINNKTKYHVSKKFPLTEKINERTLNFGLRTFVLDDYNGEVEMYIMEKTI